jgi:hypothetical protein
MPNICTCGRTWDHCRICGSKVIYRMQGASEVLSAKHGRPINVWKCRKCMVPLSELDECRADKNTIEVKDFTSKAKAQVELLNMTLEDRLNFMISNGASLEEVRATIEREGLKTEIVKSDEIKPGNIEIPKQEELPPGWSYNDKGQKVGPLSMDDLFKPKEPPKDESNS